MKKIVFLLALSIIAFVAKAQTTKPKADTTKGRDKMPYAVPQGNMPMRVIVPKHNGTMPVVKPDTSKSVNKTKTIKKTK